MSQLLLLLSVTACCVGMLSAQQAEETVDADNSQTKGLQMTERALFGSYRTVTRTGVSLQTSTVYMTCLSGISSSKCLGKRRRSHDRKMSAIKMDKEGQSGLDSSINSGGEEERLSSSENERLLAGAYTIWTTATTSTTVTVTYTDTGVTISLSYFCTAAGMEFPGIFCG